MEETAEYRDYVKKRIEQLMPIFAKAAIGDFSETLDIPEEIDEFAGLYEGVNILVEAARSRVSELEKTNAEFKEQMNATVSALETARRLEERLTEQAARLHAIVSSMGEGLLVISPHSIITIANEAASRMLGWPLDDIIGKDFHDLIKVYRGEHPIPQDQKPITSTLEREITNVVEVKDNVEWHLASGRIFPVALVSTPLPLLGETSAIVVFRDITEEKNIDAAKSEFVSLASHQLRGPLTTIKWYIQALLDRDGGALSTKQVDDITVLQGVNDRLIDLVDALLDVSRIELGTLSVMPQPSSIKDICHTSVLAISADIEKNNQHIKEAYDPSLPLVNLDPQLMELVLQNLLSNAVKYTPAGGQIMVSVNKEDDNFVIAVTDTGMGIPKSDQESMFKKFFRAENATRATTGNGLGLYMTKEVVIRMGGKIWFTTKLNKGSTFFVSMPLSGMVAREGRTRLATVRTSA